MGEVPEGWLVVVGCGSFHEGRKEVKSGGGGGGGAVALVWQGNQCVARGWTHHSHCILLQNLNIISIYVLTIAKAVFLFFCGGTFFILYIGDSYHLESIKQFCINQHFTFTKKVIQPLFVY